MVFRDPGLLFRVLSSGRIDNFLGALASVDVAWGPAGFGDQRLQTNTLEVRVADVQQVGVFQFCTCSYYRYLITFRHCRGSTSSSSGGGLDKKEDHDDRN